MTTYSKIRAIRNDKFPPKLELGCEVISKRKDTEGLQMSVIGTAFASSKIVCSCIINDIFAFKKTFKENTDITNLGKEVSLNDILILLGLSKEISLTLDVSEIEDESILCVMTDCGFTLFIELSKSIKDHDEKTLLQIYELIK
jgi:hypothetical protein